MNDIFFTILASSSSGNCAYLRVNGKHILIDAGISLTQINKGLSPFGININQIDAIFITHDHGDHYKALETIAKKHNPIIFASELVYDFITYKLPITKDLPWRVFSRGQNFSFEDLIVKTCPVQHDASETVAYCIANDKKRISWITDLGAVTESVLNLAKNSNVLVLESNYCPIMLAKSKRPLKTINRISSKHGHLSNADAIEVWKALDLNITERIFLAHVSRECNDVEHIAELLSSLPQELLDRIEIVHPISSAKRPYMFK